MFDSLVPEYDRFNSVSSMGLDSLWRRKLSRIFQDKSFILDIGTGTGRMAHTLARSGVRVLGVDFSEKMISSAQKKGRRNPLISFGVASANQLPYGDGTFDGVSSAFVLRNLHENGVLDKSFQESFRVLSLGGRMAHLELTRPPARVLAWGHAVYLKTILPFLGRSFFRSRWPKNYLKRTIQKFPEPAAICERMRQAGFNDVDTLPLHGGIASIYTGVKC